MIARRGAAIGGQRLFRVAFLAPAGLLYSVFVVYAIANCFRFSFFNWTGLGPIGSFVGMKNYEFILWSGSLSPQFWNALAHNLYFFLMTLALISIAGLTVSYTLTLVGERRAAIYKTIFFLPMVIPPIVVAYLWGMYLDPNSGAISAILTYLNLDAINIPFLGLAATALPTIAVISLWSSLGFYVFIFIPAINNIPSEIIEAARVDGAGPVRILISIVIPMILPTYITVAALVFIAAFGLFDLVYILEGPAGGPNFSTDAIASLFFRSAFGSTQGGASAGMSLAAAMAILGFIVVVGVSAFLIRLQQRASRYL